ncbi:MAG: hypothetical protein NT084_15775 [Bacteroidetes bacterium]|jgi:hypothetical protein|nr:hypothetical protein [Bacteroidota bacterium]
MKVSITVKEVNPDFDQAYADKENEGHETEDNIRYNWEDEFDVKDEVKDFGIRNNEIYLLEGMNGNEKFSFEIPSMTIVECIGENGAVTQFAASRKLIKDTKKNIDKEGNVQFYIFLKGGHEHINPIPGIYISKKDFPKALPIPDEEDITTDEEE